MIKDVNRLQVTMEQMERLIRVLEDLEETILPKDPRLFAMMAEARLQDLGRLREEVSGFVRELKPTG